MSAALPLVASPARAIKIEKFTGVQSDKPAVEVVAEEAFVRFSSGSSREGLQSLGASVIKEYDSIGWTLVALSSGMRVADGLRLLGGIPGVLEAEPDHVLRTHLTPNDPLVSQQYGLSQINAFSAWQYETGFSSRVSVAVVDSGIDSTHQDLAGKVLTAQSRTFDPTTGANVTGTSSPTSPACSHGTNVSGVAAANTNNSVGMAGVSWGASLISLKVFRNADCAVSFPTCDDNSCATDNAGIISALNYAASIQNTAAAGRIVVNMSLGGAGPCPATVQTAVSNAVAAGVVVVAASGNDGGPVNNPANCSGVIPVGATDSGGNIASFSSNGPELANSGLVAPGVSVVTTDLGNIYSQVSGTSFSSPHVAGAAALILSAKPQTSPSQVQAILRGTADANISTAGVKPRGTNNGAGGLDLFRALRLAVTGSASFAGDTTAFAFPNPFRPASAGTVAFTVPTNVQGPHLRVRVYNQAGELVREILGRTWDGKNANGAPAATGTYLFEVSSDAGSATGRFAVIR